MLFWNGKAKHPIEKIKAEKKKKKKRKKCGCKTSVDMTDGREICGHPNIRLIYGSTFSQFFDFPHKTFVSKFDFLIFSFSFFFLSSSISLCNEGKVIAQKYSTWTFPHLNFTVVFFVSLHMRQRIDKTDWMTTWDELAHLSKTSQQGKTAQLASAHLIY